MYVENIATKLKAFVAADSQVPLDDGEFTCDVHLFEAGYLDSLSLVRLLAFVEADFTVQLDETQLFSEEFTTINGIASLIEAALPADKLAAEATPEVEPTLDPDTLPGWKRPGLSGWFSKVRSFGR